MNPTAHFIPEAPPAPQATPCSPLTFSLNGPWVLRGRDTRSEATVALAGEVPGHVHVDLLREGLIPDPFWRDNAMQCQWVERWDWTYERSFELPPEATPNRALIEFAGIDTFAAIELNGQPLGRVANMFVPHRFEVGPLLRPGENILRVHIDSIWRHVADKPRDAECAFENQERLYVRRMQCTFHWDWVNRFVSAGIWRSVTLLFPARARATELFVSTREIRRGRSGEPAAATLRVRWEAELADEESVLARLELHDPSGVLVWGRDQLLDQTRPQVEREAVIEHPLLWWPNGSGGQPLYTARLILLEAGEEGRELDRREVVFGIRTVRIERRPDAPGGSHEARTRELRALHPERDGRNGDAPGESFTVRVNGEPIFCKGGNWVPADPWPSRVSVSHYERLLGLARDAHVNCLRAWGGGIYEPEAFWQACDRLGILVAQDFQMACAHYPEADADFMAAMRAEIPAAIRMLRNHPSLGWWIGDNENGMKFDFDDQATAGRRIAEEIARPALRELDPDRPFEPTSPFGGRPNSSQPIGDVHLSALPHRRADFERDWQPYRRWIDESIGRFNSECVTAGAPTRRSLRRFLSAEDIADPQSPLWYFHTKDNPYMDIRLFDVQRLSAEKLFGPPLRPEDLLPRLEYVQYEFARLTIEAARRQKGYNQGLLFWMFNDCWPATGWSFVDYYGTPKAAWFAMKRAFAPVIASIEDVVDCYRFWVCNDRLTPVSGELHLRIQPWTGPARWSDRLVFSVPANSSGVVHEIPKTSLPRLGDAVLVCDLSGADGLAHRAWHFDGLPLAMTPPPARLDLRWSSSAPGFATLSITTDNYARIVTLETDADVADNYFDLLPGETKILTLPAPSYPATLPDVKFTCWNSA